MPSNSRKKTTEEVVTSGTYKQIMVDHYWVLREDNLLRFILGTNTIPSKGVGKTSALVTEAEIMLTPETVESMRKDFETWEKNRKRKAGKANKGNGK